MSETAEVNDNQGLMDAVADSEDQQSTGQEPEAISHIQQDAASEEKTSKERPDYWPEKFWKSDSSEPDLEGISKSYKELEKQFRAGKHKAPTDGKYSLEAVEGLSAEDPVVQTYMGWAQKYGISQQAFEDLAKEITANGAALQQETKISIAKEREALGPNADAIIANMATWGRGLVAKGIWGKEDFEEFKVMGGTAAGLRALMKLRETYEGRVPVQSAPAEGALSDEELHAMVANPEYKSNAAYRAKVEKLFEKRYG